MYLNEFDDDSSSGSSYVAGSKRGREEGHAGGPGVGVGGFFGEPTSSSSSPSSVEHRPFTRYIDPLNRVGAKYQGTSFLEGKKKSLLKAFFGSCASETVRKDKHTLQGRTCLRCSESVAGE